MRCPNCNKKMENGFVRALGRGGICWVNEKVDYGAPREAEGFLQIGKAPWLKGESVPAFNCRSCKWVIIDYSNL